MLVLAYNFATADRSYALRPSGFRSCNLVEMGLSDDEDNGDEDDDDDDVDRDVDVPGDEEYG